MDHGDPPAAQGRYLGTGAWKAATSSCVGGGSGSAVSLWRGGGPGGFGTGVASGFAWRGDAPRAGAGCEEEGGEEGGEGLSVGLRGGPSGTERRDQLHCACRARKGVFLASLSPTVSRRTRARPCRQVGACRSDSCPLNSEEVPSHVADHLQDPRHAAPLSGADLVGQASEEGRTVQVGAVARGREGDGRALPGELVCEPHRLR